MRKRRAAIPELMSSWLNVSLPLADLMAISDREIALISRTADSLRKADIAPRESWAGELVAHRNVTVSRRIRIQGRSKKASSSWSVIGFHQLGSWIMILPLRVPNLG